MEAACQAGNAFILIANRTLCLTILKPVFLQPGCKCAGPTRSEACPCREPSCRTVCCQGFSSLHKAHSCPTARLSGWGVQRGVPSGSSGILSRGCRPRHVPPRVWDPLSALLLSSHGHPCHGTVSQCPQAPASTRTTPVPSVTLSEASLHRDWQEA